MISKVSCLFTTVALTLSFGDSFLIFQSKTAGGVPRQLVIQTTTSWSKSFRMAGNNVDINEDKFDYSEDEIKNYVSKLPLSLQETVSKLLMADREGIKIPFPDAQAMTSSANEAPMASADEERKAPTDFKAFIARPAFQKLMTVGSDKEPTAPPTEKRSLESSLPLFSSYRVPKAKKAVLALDGGGVRGLITTYVLEALETELREQTKIKDLLIGEAFDVVAGTSTGSILAAYLTAYCGLAEKTKNYTAKKEVVEFFREGGATKGSGFRRHSCQCARNV
jgi:hypothetical protein